MRLLSYQRHFLALGGATVLLAFLDSQLTFYGEWRFITEFAFYGAFHGIAVCFGLRSEPGTIKQLCFVLLAASASVAAPYAGFGMVRFLFPSGMEGDLSLFLPITAASIAGAAIYWTILRIYWFPALTIGSFVLAIVICALVSPGSYLVSAALTGFGASDVPAADMVPTIAWWFAFSLALFLWDQTRRHDHLGDIAADDRKEKSY